MKNKLNKFIIFALIFAMVLTSGSCPTFANSGIPLLYEDIKGQIPFDTLSLPDDYKNKPYINVNIKGKSTKLYFNTELWLDKNIGVYGDYRYVPSNDFKNYTENPNPSVKTPYYTKNGVKGEYRYHGYTLDGIRHTNKSFPVDQASNRKAEEKEWQYHYWENSYLAKKQDGKISQYNDKALEGNKYTQEWINEGIPFEVKNGNNSSRNKYDYANVLTPSTPYTYGEAKMWHENNSGYWYQTFTMKKRDKKQTQVSLDVNILNKNDYVMSPGHDTATIKVAVTITLQDDAYYNDEIEKQVYYTRDDIKQYNLELNGTTYTFNGNSKSNTYKGTVYLDIRRSIMSVNGDYEVNGVANITYRSDKNLQSNNAYADDSDKMNQSGPFNKQADLISKFTVAELVEFDDETPITAEQFNYQDASIGKIIKYQFELTGEDGQKINTTYNTSSMDSTTINNLLLQMAQGKEYYDINVKQTVYNSNKSAVYEKNVSIYRGIIQKEIIEINVDLPDKCFDIRTYGASIGDMEQKDIDRLEVTVDGVSVPMNQFFYGDFTFGAIKSNNNTEPHFIEVSATSKDDITSYVQRWVTVYNTKPKVQLTLQGSTKQNRKFEVLNTSDSANDPYLLQHYPTSYTYSITALNDSDINKLYSEKQGDNHIMQGLEEATYQITCTATNSTGRSSEYILPLVIMKDYKPTMSFNIWNNYLTRNEALSMDFSVESVDGDNIINKTITILKDNDKDGTYETTVLNQPLTDDFTYTPSELGFYRAIITAQESFGEETLKDQLDGTEKRSNEIIRDFFVENLRPLTEVHLDIPFNFPEIDVIIALDKNLSNSKRAEIKSKRIDFNNTLRSQGINPTIELWDMKVYEFSTPSSTTKNTGGSQPPSSLEYSNNGYSGTLTKYNEANNWYWHDFGYYTTERECHTETYTSVDSSCYRECRASDMNDHCCSWYCEVEKTKRVCSNVRVWHSDDRKVNNWTGYYNGTIYKYVRQEEPIQTFRPNADKYMIYVSEDGINTTTSSEHKDTLPTTKEFADITNEHDFKVTLIGDDNIKSQYTSYDTYYDTTDIMKSIDNALNDIMSDNPFSSDYLVEVNETINIDSVELESEGDELKESAYKYVHDSNIYDNPLGMFSFANLTFVDDTNWTTYKPTLLDKTGKLEIYHKVKDSISGYEDEELYSNIFKTSINIHRKPIADFDLDWTYDEANKVYKTSWVDKSYDLDHEFNHPDKGIIDRKIIYWNNTYPSEKFYKIPDDLQPGATYTVQYSVRDLERTWSEPNLKQFTLQTLPPPQLLDAKLKTELPKFSLLSIPTSENIISYDTKTRFPYNHYLEMAFYNNGNTKVTNNLEVHYTGTEAIINGQDYNWKDATYNIPETLADGNYKFRVYTVAEANTSNRTYKEFNVTLNTPIDLNGNIPTDKITYDKNIPITATTSKYTNKVEVTLFQGTSYERTEFMTLVKTEADTSYWTLNYIEDRNQIPDGNYIARLRGTTPNGNEEIQDKNYEFTHNTPPTVTMLSTEPSFVYEGDDVSANIRIHDIDLDTLTIKIELIKDGTIIHTIQLTTSPTGNTYDPISSHLINNISLGNYAINVTIDDGNGGIVTDNIPFTVNELTIIGHVEHVDKWNDNRIKYNNSKTGTDNRPRDYNTYWSGERFIVSADTTIINPLSTVEANKVEVEIVGEPYHHNLSTTNKTAWSGELWDDSMMHKWGRSTPETLTLRFTVDYSNGLIKTHDVIITIDDSEDYWRYHRKF